MARAVVGASSQYLEVQSTPVTAAPLTFSLWVNLANIASYQYIGGLFNPLTDDDYFRLIMLGSAFQAWVSSAAPSVYGWSEVSSVTGSNQWHHVVAVYTSNVSRTAYFDGVAGNHNTDNVTPAGMARISVGRGGRLNPEGYMTGSIAEPAIWNVALTAPQITALAAGASPMALATLPVRYWRLKNDLDFTDLVAASVLTNSGSTWTVDHPTVNDPPVPPVTAGMFWF